MKRIIDRTLTFFKRNYYLGSVPLIFLSFPSFDIFILKGFPFFAWFSLVPLFRFVRGRGLRDVFFYSYITGVAGYFLAFQWIGNFGKDIQGGYIVINVLLMISLAAFFSFKVFAAEVLSRRFENLRFLIFPSFWILVDWIESIGFLAFPWPVWGHSQYPFTPFIHLASFTGIMGVTFVIVLFNYLASDLAYAWSQERFSIRRIYTVPAGRKLIGVAVFVAVVTVYGAVLLVVNNRPVKRDLRVGMVQSCISPWEDWYVNKMRYLYDLKKYTLQIIEDNPDFIIWSESATLEHISYNYDRGYFNDFEKDLFDFILYMDRPLLTGEIGVVEEFSLNGPSDPRLSMPFRRRPQNNAVFINSYGEVIKTYPKIHLVPFGEWFPYGVWLEGIQNILFEMGASRFIPGEKPELFEMKGKKFGCLICYEGIFYRLCREYRKLGADYLVNITNDGWTKTYQGHMQHFSASVFRAIENGIWYIRVGNTGYTAIIDPYGRIRKDMPILIKDSTTGDLDFSFNRKTVYYYIGDLFLYLVFGFLGVCLAWFAVEIVRERVSR